MSLKALNHFGGLVKFPFNSTHASTASSTNHTGIVNLLFKKKVQNNKILIRFSQHHGHNIM